MQQASNCSNHLQSFTLSPVPMIMISSRHCPGSSNEVYGRHLKKSAQGNAIYHTNYEFKLETLTDGMLFTSLCVTSALILASKSSYLCSEANCKAKTKHIQYLHQA